MVCDGLKFLGGQMLNTQRNGEAKTRRYEFPPLLNGGLLQDLINSGLVN